MSHDDSAPFSSDYHARPLHATTSKDARNHTQPPAAEGSADVLAVSSASTCNLLGRKPYCKNMADLHVACALCVLILLHVHVVLGESA